MYVRTLCIEGTVRVISICLRHGRGKWQTFLLSYDEHLSHARRRLVVFFLCSEIPYTNTDVPSVVTDGPRSEQDRADDLIGWLAIPGPCSAVI